MATFVNLYTDAANRLRVPTSNTAEITKVKRLMNQRYKRVWFHRPWWFAVKQGVLTTVAPITTGTVSVTNNSTTITFSSAPTPSVANRIFKVVGGNQDPDVEYLVSAHTAGATTATLDVAYTGVTDGAASFRVYQPAYSLATDVLHLLDPRSFGRPYLPQPIGITELRNLFRMFPDEEGKPRFYSMFDFATSGSPATARRILVFPAPDEAYILRYDYHQTVTDLSADADEPRIPEEYRHVLVYGTLADYYRDYLADESRAAENDALYADMIQGMASDVEPTENRPRIVFEGGYRRRRRITAANSDLGAYFDRWGDPGL